MNIWKVLAIIFTVFSFGVISETRRIFTSNDEDIAADRSSLIPMSLILGSLIIGATIFFWQKSRKKNLP